MRQRSSIELSQPPAEPMLHPVLQGVLDSLDVEIDEELIKYRLQRRQAEPVRSRRKSPFTPRSVVLPPMPSPSIELPSGQSSGSTGLIGQDENRPLINASGVGLSRDESSLTSANQLAPYETPHSLSCHPEAIAVAAASATAPDPFGHMTEPDSFKNTDTDDGIDPLDGYFASSEELLRGMGDEERYQPQSHTLLETLLTPLGVGSMLLLLLSSVTLGIVVMNPTSLNGVMAFLWPRPNATPTSTASLSPTPDQAPSPEPDLSSQEFVDVNLDTLSRLSNGARPSPTTPLGPPLPSEADKTAMSTAAAALFKSSTPQSLPPSNSPSSASNGSEPAPASSEPAPQSAYRSAPAPEPTPSASYSPEPAYEAAPAPEPAYEQPQPTYQTEPEPQAYSEPPSAPPPEAPQEEAYAPASPVTPSPRYYIVGEYSGDASLQQARQVVGDAYVRNFAAGAEIQYGAVSDPDRAQELVTELQQQGIPARVYHPQ